MPESRVFNDSDDFTPMPTPDQVVGKSEADRLDPIPFQFSDIQAMAVKILKRAGDQGKKILDDARAQVAAMEKQAMDKAYKESFPKGEQDGFAKGEKEGREAAQAEMKAELEKEREALRQEAAAVRGVLEQLAAIMNDNRQQLLAQAEGDLLLLALDIAKRLVGRELSVDPEAVRPIAIEAIGLVTERSGVTVRVNPDDYKVMEESIPDLKAIFPDLGAVTIEADASIERGGIMAATREAEVDMRLATRLAAFEEAILGMSGQQAVAPWSTIEPGAAEKLDHDIEPHPETRHPEQSKEAETPAPEQENQETPEQQSAAPAEAKNDDAENQAANQGNDAGNPIHTPEEGQFELQSLAEHHDNATPETADAQQNATASAEEASRETPAAPEQQEPPA